MPTASAKVEKIASNEASDPIKQIVVLVEKKVRNLEKRKGKLDNYRNDHKNGKELNEDQKNAIMKYDQVIEVLEFVKELQKSFNVIFQETARYQKKAQKKEFAERQHHEFQQIRQLLLFQNILAKLLIDDIRNDFLNGKNGAIKLSEEEIDNLEKFYKMISLEESNVESQSYENHFSSAAEHLVALLEAKNRNIFGITYKHLKDTLVKIQECGYFTNQSIQTVSEDSPEEEQQDLSEGETKEENQKEKEDLSTEVEQSIDNVNGSSEVSEPLSVIENEEICAKPTDRPNNPTNQLQDVLPIQGNFNFLQESQIDMESPHMDPAVVVAHPMAPPPNTSYRQSQYNSVTTSTSQIMTENETPCIPTTIVVPLQPISVPSPGNPALTLSQAALNHPPQDYDPNQPIPTQTFTNQNFVAMQNIMTVVSPYVPVTVPAQHFTPDNLLPQQSSNIINSVESSVLDLPVTDEDNDIAENTNNTSNDNEVEEVVSNVENTVMDHEQEVTNHTENQANYTSHVQNNHQSRSFNNRGSRGGRGRGSYNCYLRGRSYGNGRGYYQGSYGGRDSSGSSSGYNGYRRPPRGGIRGGIRGGNNRGGRGGGGGGFRPQQ